MQRPIARHCKLLWKPVLNPAVTGSTSRKAKNAYEEHRHIIFSLESNIFYAAKKQALKFTDILNEIMCATLNDSNAETAM